MKIRYSYKRKNARHTRDVGSRETPCSAVNKVQLQTENRNAFLQVGARVDFAINALTAANLKRLVNNSHAEKFLSQRKDVLNSLRRSRKCDRHEGPRLPTKPRSAPHECRMRPMGRRRSRRRTPSSMVGVSGPLRLGRPVRNRHLALSERRRLRVRVLRRPTPPTIVAYASIRTPRQGHGGRRRSDWRRPGPEFELRNAVWDAFWLVNSRWW